MSGILNGTDVFFVKSAGANSPAVNAAPGGDIMAEVSCEFPATETCNYDQPSFKAYLSRWMALTTQLVPWSAGIIMPRLQASAMAAAAQCSGTTTAANTGTVCGRRWYQTGWDGFSGVGEQMSALSVIQSNLISKVAPPVSANQGGTSKSDPTAGSGSNDGNAVTTNPIITRVISTSDKAGAGILTAISLVLVLAMTWWIVV